MTKNESEDNFIERTVQEFGTEKNYDFIANLWKIDNLYEIWLNVKPSVKAIYTKIQRKTEKYNKNAEKYKKKQKNTKITWNIHQNPQLPFKSHKIPMNHGNINGFRVIKI